MTALGADEIRQLLRECVTVVKPGETLIIRADENWTPYQIRELQDSLDTAIRYGDLGFSALIVPGAELGVADGSDEAFATRVMDTLNALDAHADSAGYVHVNPARRKDGWWPPRPEPQP